MQITDEEQLERIAALAIPPAWTDVSDLSPNPRAGSRPRASMQPGASSTATTRLPRRPRSGRSSRACSTSRKGFPRLRSPRRPALQGRAPCRARLRPARRRPHQRGAVQVGSSGTPPVTHARGLPLGERLGAASPHELRRRTHRAPRGSGQLSRQRRRAGTCQPFEPPVDGVSESRTRRASSSCSSTCLPRRHRCPRPCPSRLPAVASLVLASPTSAGSRLPSP